MVWFKVKGVYGNTYLIRSDAITYFGYCKDDRYTFVSCGDNSMRCEGNIVPMLSKELMRLSRASIIEIKGEKE